MWQVGKRDRPAAIFDLFLTFFHIPHLRICVGLFRNPGPEETHPSGFVPDYIQFSDFVAREYLETFTKGATISSPKSEAGCVSGGIPQATGYGFSAARDWGLQAFDTINVFSRWNLLWAVKIGRGEAITSFDDWNTTPELYLYAAAAYRLKGRGRHPENGVKVYSWFQWGRRSFATDPENRSFDGFRYGAGMKTVADFFGVRQRITVDFMGADGMILLSTTGNVKGGVLRYAAGRGNRNRAFTVDYGLYQGRWQLNYRWHFHQILHHFDGRFWSSADRRNITEHTVGLHYSLMPKLKLVCDFIMRHAHAPENSEHNVDVVMKSLGNRLAIQVTWLFKQV